MRQFNIFLLVMVPLFLATRSTQAQQAVLSSGGEITSDDGSVSYSIGQLGYTEFSSDSGSAHEGVQHSVVISVVAGVDEKDIDLSVTTYPNPTTDLLTLQIENPKESLSASLVDMNGIRIKTYSITEHKTIVDMSGLARSVYLLSISRNETHLKTFRIIKE